MSPEEPKGRSDLSLPPGGYSHVSVAGNLPKPIFGSTMEGQSPPKIMLLRPRKNRRKVDPAKRAAELKAAAKARAPFFLRVFGTVAVLAGLAFGSFYGWRWAQTSPRFAITAIHLTGNERATEGELLKLSGLATGQNLVSLDVAAAERALLAHPWVKSAHLKRRLPSTLEVTVSEHVPSALVSLGDLYLVDADGVPFKKVAVSDAQKTPVDLPLLSGVDRDAYLKSTAAANQRFASGIALARAFRAAGGGKSKVSEVRLDGDAATVVTVDGLTVLLGEPPWDEKLDRFQAVEVALAKQRLTAEVVHLDNRAHPGWVAVMPKGANKVPGPILERGKPPAK